MKKWSKVAWVTPLALAVAMTSCGNLKKKEFLPEYEAYKNETSSKFSSLQAETDSGKARLMSLEKEDMSLKTAIDDAKEDAMAAAEQGDADTLSASKGSAKEMDEELRAQLMMAVKDAQMSAEEGDKKTLATVSMELETVKSSVTDQLNASATTTSDSISALRAEVADALLKAKPVNAATVHFAVGKVAVSDADKKKVDESLQVIKDHPDMTVNVIGHADSSPVTGGKYQTNLELSEARAKAVADYLKTKGVMNKMVVVGRGHFETAGAQSSADGRAESRRVEIILTAE
jgi:outer membrane protein OmpA-like peptidoglycan-associated protein